MTKLRVYHIPQVPMKAFYVEVATPEEAIKILDVLADYDLFQFENNVKGDYCNAQGLETLEDFEGDGNLEWCEWHDPETDFDIREYRDHLLETSDG
jgi:hypothetical protein